MSRRERLSRSVMVLANSRPGELKVILEPWGEELVVPAGRSVTINDTGTADGHLEIELRESTTVVYGWQGSVLSMSLIQH